MRCVSGSGSSANNCRRSGRKSSAPRAASFCVPPIPSLLLLTGNQGPAASFYYLTRHRRSWPPSSVRRPAQYGCGTSPLPSSGRFWCSMAMYQALRGILPFARPCWSLVMVTHTIQPCSLGTLSPGALNPSTFQDTSPTARYKPCGSAWTMWTRVSSSPRTAESTYLLLWWPKAKMMAHSPGLLTAIPAACSAALDQNTPLLPMTMHTRNLAN